MPVISKRSRTPQGETLTVLILQLFRVNSLILAAGDRLAAHLDLTGARWQILGAVVRAGQPQSVAWHARDLGTSRQNVQRIVNDLEDLGFITFETNPHHRRAQLVVVTGKGREVYAAAMALQAPWVNKVSEDLTTRDLQAFERVLLSMREKLESSDRA
jgi:DNA-binding MarR family transcriptional regulator